MARIVSGPLLTGRVVSATGAPLAGVTVTPSATVYTDPELSASVTTLTTNGGGVFTAFARPGVYTFTCSDPGATPIESVEVLSSDEGGSGAYVAKVGAQTVADTQQTAGGSGAVGDVYTLGFSANAPAPQGGLRGLTIDRSVSGAFTGIGFTTGGVHNWDMGLDFVSTDFVFAYDPTLTADVLRMRQTGPWLTLADSAQPQSGHRLAIGSYAAADTALTALLVLNLGTSTGSPNANYLLCVAPNTNAVVTIDHTGTLTAQNLTLNNAALAAANTILRIDAPSGKQGSLIFHTNTAGDIWQEYVIDADGHLYIRDLVNAKMHVTLTAGAGTGGTTEINSALKVDGSVGFYGTAPAAKQSITGALSTVADAAAKAVLTSIISALTTTGYATNGTT